MSQTITEKILAKAAHKKVVHPGDNIWVDVNVLMTHDVCGPGMISVFHKKFGKDAKVWDPEKIVIIPDHYIYTGDQQAHKNLDTIRQFAFEQQIKNFFDVGTKFNYKKESLSEDYHGVCHIAMAEGGFNRPGEIVFGTDSHTCTSGAFGAFACGIGDADGSLICGIGKLWLIVPEQLKFNIDGKIPEYSMAKDIILTIIGKIGVGGATNCSMEFTGSGIDALSVEDKMTICNMAIEAGRTNGIMEPNQEMINYVKARTSVPFEVIKSDANAKYKQIYNFKGSDIVPCVAQPHSPDKYAKVTDLSDVKLTRTYIGSCTGGKTSDFIAAAKILKGHKVNIETLIVPATVQVEKSLYTEKIDGVTLAEIFDKAGCVKPLAPGCQACLGGPQDTAGRANSKEVVVSTTNRNFIGRMGSKEAQIYLASPYTAAASAISGKIADPREYL